MPPRNEFTEGEMEVFMMTILIMVTMLIIVVIFMRNMSSSNDDGDDNMFHKVFPELSSLMWMIRPTCDYTKQNVLFKQQERMC